MANVKVSFIGGASMTWMPTFSQELLSCPELAGSTIVLMDIDKPHLDVMEQYVNRMKREFESDVSIVATTDRQEALSGADFVVITFMAGGHDYGWGWWTAAGLEGNPDDRRDCPGNGVSLPRCQVDQLHQPDVQHHPWIAALFEHSQCGSMSWAGA